VETATGAADATGFSATFSPHAASHKPKPIGTIESEFI
jgi:hypothetical protein